MNDNKIICCTCNEECPYHGTKASETAPHAVLLLETLKRLEENARNAALFLPHILLVSAVEEAQRVIAKVEGTQ